MNIPTDYTPAHEILPGLWLGNRGAALDGNFLTEKKIGAVFNCSKEIPFSPKAKATYRIPVDDNLQPEEIRNLELMSVEFLPLLRKEWLEGPILIHCHAGMQRSAAVMAMFLMNSLGLSSDVAMKYIRYKRPIAFTPVPNFLDAIRGVERRLESERSSKAYATLDL